MYESGLFASIELILERLPDDSRDAMSSRAGWNECMSPLRPDWLAVVNEATRLHNLGYYDQAARLYLPIIDRAPDDPQLLRLAGMALREGGRIGDAVALFRRTIALAPKDPAAYFELAVLYQGEGRHDEARRCLDVLDKLNPGHPACMALRARMLSMEGRFAEAYEAVRPAVDRGDDHPAVVLIFAKLAHRFGRQDEALTLLRRLAGDEKVDSGTHSQALFHIGDILAQRREYDAAFDAYRQANDLFKTAFDPAAHAAAVDRLIQAWTPEAIGRLPAPPCDSELPVFIVGMPRSCTSLLEQMLATLPGVYGGGERREIMATVSDMEQTPGAISLEHPEMLTAKLLRRRSDAILRSYRREAPDAVRVTDKLPDNFLHLGLIARLFPKARVLHCVREPADTCISCYFQHFTGRYDWIYNLTHIAEYHAGYVKVMDHWRRVAQPLGLQMLDVRYDSLINEPEQTMRRVVDFIGLPWDPACLAFHENPRMVNTASNEQVRQPIFKTSAGRHRHYLKHIEPLMQSLAQTAASQHARGTAD